METDQNAIPQLLPVMALPESVLFPRALLPLYIFEERYRAMLAWSLERGRMFCVALAKPGREGAAEEDDIYPVGCAGLVRACVRGADGTSHLVLQGVERVRFVEFLEGAPFRVARVRPLPTRCDPGVETDALRCKVVELCGRLRDTGIVLSPQFQTCLPKLCNCATVADVVASTLIEDVRLRQQLLEEPSVAIRLRTLIAALARRLSMA